MDQDLREQICFRANECLNRLGKQKADAKLYAAFSAYLATVGPLDWRDVAEALASASRTHRGDSAETAGKRLGYFIGSLKQLVAAHPLAVFHADLGEFDPSRRIPDKLRDGETKLANLPPRRQIEAALGKFSIGVRSGATARAP